MDINKVIVTGRMVQNLEKLALLDTKRKYLFLPEAEVSPDHFDWADAYVAFKPTASFHFGRLRWVHALGAGVDSFLYNRVWNKDVLLTRTVGNFGQKIGEYCLSYVLADLQRHDQFHQHQAGQQWVPSQQKLLQQLHVVIFGTGTIGQEVAKMLGAFGVQVVGISRSGTANRYFHQVLPMSEVHSCIADADWVINTLPLTVDTDGCFGVRMFAGMKGAGFINVGRGGSVDEAALLQAIDHGQVRRAVLDVFREEPLPARSPLWKHPGVIVTPHISAVTGVDEAVNGFLAVLEDIDQGRQQICHAVDVSRGY